MDNCRFDNWTRMVARQENRRTAVKGLAGGIAALATLVRVELGFAQDGEVGIESNCIFNGDRCRRDHQCCSQICKNHNCKCADAGEDCRADAGCCKGFCRGSDNTCRCIPNNSGKACKADGDCCSKNCENDKCKCVKRAELCRNDDQCCPGLKCQGRICK